MRNEQRGQSINLGALKNIGYFLTIWFCALRACGVINWSWFWIMFPIFFSCVLSLGALVVLFLLQH